MSELGSLVVKLGLQDNDFQSGVKRLNSSMKNIQSEFKASTTGLSGFDKALQTAKAKTEMLTKSIDVQRDIVKKHEDAYKKSKDTLDKNIQTHEKLKVQLTNVKGAYEESKNTLGENAKATLQLKKEYEQLSKEFQQSEQKIKNNINTTQNWETKVNNATTKLKGLESELKQSSRELDIQGNKWVQLANKIEPVGKKLDSIGSKASNVGKGLTAAITVPIVGVGAAAVKMAADFEQGMSNVKSVSNASAKEMEKLNKLALDLGAETKYSALEASKGIEELLKSGLSTEQVLNGGLKGALSLAAAGEIELKDAAEIASTALNAFKNDVISVGDAANILAGAANASATDVGELKYGLSMVSAVASGVGASFKDTATALAVFAQNGLKGSDAGTSLKTMLLNLQPKTDKAYDEFERLGLMTYNTDKAFEFLASKGIKATGKSFEEIDPLIRKHVEVISGAKIGTAKFDKSYREFTMQIGASQSIFYDNNGKLKTMSDISEILHTKLSGLNDSQRQMALNTMFGTDAIRAANIMYKEGAKGINDMASAMDKITADDTAKIKMDNLKGAIEEMSGSLETAAITIGTKAIPTIKSIAETINSLTDKFMQLSPGTQDAIIKFGLFAACAGPVLMGVGAIGTGVGTLTTTFKGLSTVVAGLTAAQGIASVGAAATAAAGVGTAGGIAGLGASLGAAAISAAPFLLAAAAVAGTGYVIYKGMTEEAIPSVDLFADKVQVAAQQVSASNAGMATTIQTTTTKISEETKKAVRAYLDLDKGATNSLNNLYYNSTKLTDTNTKDLVSKYNSMNQTIIKSMADKNGKVFTETQAFFEKSNALTEKEEADILKKKAENNTNAIAEETKNNARILEILNNAKKANRELKQEEFTEINALQEKKRQSAVKTLSKEEVESKVILERLKQSTQRLTAEQASEVIKNAEKQRASAVQKAEQQYNQSVANIIRMRDETGEITAEQATRLIGEAERQKTESIKKAEEMKTQVVAKVKEQNKGIEKDVDMSKGNILDAWDKLKKWWDEWKPSSKDFSANVKTTKESVEIKRIYTDARDSRYDTPKAARGTSLSGHPGGPLITSEKGRELGILPGGSMFLTGNSGSEFWPNMPRGTHIIPNLETERILRRKGVPGYASGTGLKLSNFQRKSVNTNKYALDFNNLTPNLDAIRNFD